MQHPTSLDASNRALEMARRLRDALRAEIDRAQEEHRLLRTLDVEALLRQATLRAAFNAHVAFLDGELGHLLPSTRPDEARAPALGNVLTEIRALAASLHELDLLNRNLAERALRCVRSYLSGLTPAAESYDRRGARLPTSRAQTGTSTHV